MPDRSSRGSVAGAILAAITALMLVYVIAAPALAQSPGASASASAAASVRASVAASPGGQPGPTATGLPDTAIADPGSTPGGISPFAILLLGIGAVAATLVYLGMRSAEVQRQPAGSDRNPPGK